MAKPHPDVVNIDFLGAWRAHAKFQPIWSKYLAIMPRHTYIHTCTYEPKYIFESVHDSNSLGPSLIQKQSFGTFSLYYQMGKGNARKNPTHVTPKIKLFNYTRF